MTGKVVFLEIVVNGDGAWGGREGAWVIGDPDTVSFELTQRKLNVANMAAARAPATKTSPVRGYLDAPVGRSTFCRRELSLNRVRAPVRQLFGGI